MSDRASFQLLERLSKDLPNTRTCCPDCLAFVSNLPFSKSMEVHKYVFKVLLLTISRSYTPFMTSVRIEEVRQCSSQFFFSLISSDLYIFYLITYMYAAFYSR